MSLALANTSLQQRLDDLRAKHRVPGASLAVSQGDEIETVASGVLNLDTGVETTSESLFQIGSITKVWTTTVAMQLVDEGLLTLDAPVRTYVPEFRVADEFVSRSVTIRHLLSHSSGIDGDHFADTGRGDDALEKYVLSCAPLRQVHPLGATMSYCNTGFSLLGRVIEVVTGEVWDAAIRARLFEPLGLGHTATLPEEVLRYRAAMGHIEPPGQELRTASVWGLPRTAGPAGGICATSSDVLRFARLHLSAGEVDRNRIVSAESVQAMQVPQVDVPSGGDGLPGHRSDRWRFCVSFRTRAWRSHSLRTAANRSRSTESCSASCWPTSPASTCRPTPCRRSRRCPSTRPGASASTSERARRSASWRVTKASWRSRRSPDSARR
jgi:CubicO group peptidase (beta-lactamase class C family)